MRSWNTRPSAPFAVSRDCASRYKCFLWMACDSSSGFPRNFSIGFPRCFNLWPAIRWFYTSGADYWVCPPDKHRQKSRVRKKLLSKPGQARTVNVIWKTPVTIPRKILCRTGSIRPFRNRPFLPVILPTLIPMGTNCLPIQIPPDQLNPLKK